MPPDAAHRGPPSEPFAALLEAPVRLAAVETELRALRDVVEQLRRATPPAVVSLSQAAGHLGVSVSPLRRRAKAGELPVVRIGRSIRVDLSRLQPVDNATVADLAASARHHR